MKFDSFTNGGVGLSFIAASLLLSVSLKAGEILIYDPENGATLAPQTLITYTGPFDNSIAPSNTSPSDNTVSIKSKDNANALDSVFGGYSQDKKVYNNTVNMSGGKAEYYIYGGLSDKADAYENTINISDGEVANVIGGRSYEAKAYSNTVNISDGCIEWVVYGGSSSKADVINNTVNISGGEVSSIGGGFSEKANAINNTVNILGNATIREYLVGGNSTKDSFTGNTLNIAVKNQSAMNLYNFEWVNFYLPSNISNGDTILTLNNNGGTNLSNSKLGVAVQDGARLNTGDRIVLLTNTNGIVINDFSNYIGDTLNRKKLTYSGSSAYEFEISKVGNSIIALAIDPNNIPKNFVYDPDGSSTPSNFAPRYMWFDGTNEVLAPYSASENTITVKSGSLKKVVGGYNRDTKVEKNNLTIEGGTINRAIYGGYSDSGEASDNVVTIKGGTISGEIIGGNSIGVTNKNVVNILEGGNLNLDPNVAMIGGTGSSRAGNTLNIARKGLEFKNIRNFEWVNFYLPSNISNGDTMLTLNNNGRTNLSNSKLGVAVQDGARLNTGDKITLIKKTGTGNLNSPNNMSNYIDDPSNVRNLFNTGRLTATNLASIYTFELSNTANEIIATTNNQPNESQKNLSETSISSLGMITASADIISSEALALASSAASSSLGALGSFAGGSGQSIRYNSGSHVDVKGINLVAGISSSIDNNLYGAFIEFGKGNYDSYNSFNTGNIKGEGDTRYYGIGALGKFDLSNSSFYIDSSIRVGRVKSDYIGYGFGSSIPEYKSSRTYYGAHIGIGKVIDINDNSNVDIYTKALYTRVSKESIEILTNSYEFKAINSIRAKLGARYNYSIDEKQSLYIGAAYEREFDSKSKAKNLTTNYEITAPSIKGNSYIGELGYKIKAMQTNRGTLNLGANIQGIAGKKEGVSGGVSVEWKIK